MFVLGGRVGDWLRGSLRHWLLMPVASVTLLLALAVSILGLAVIDQNRAGRLQDSVALASTVALNAVMEQAGELNAGVEYAAGSEAVQAAMLGPQTLAASADVMAALQPLGVESILLMRAAGRAITQFSPRNGARAGQQVLAGWAVGERPDPALVALLQGLAAPGSTNRGARIGLTPGESEAALFAVSPVSKNDERLGLVMITLPLRRALQVAYNPMGGGVAVYDLAGQPLFSTFTAEGLALTALPRLPDAAQAGNAPRAEPHVERATVAGRGFAYAVQFVTAGDEDLGYISVWQPYDASAASTRRWQAIFLLVVLLGAGGILSVTSSLASIVVRPITLMADAARGAARGEGIHPVPAGGVGELAVLAQAFNHMAGRVQEQTAALREQARQADYLFQAGSELARTLDFEESLQTAAEAIYGLGSAAYVLVLTGHGELGPYTCGAVRGLPADVATQVFRHEYRVPLWGVMARALVSRQPVVIDDIAGQNAPRSGEFNWNIGTGSMLLLPVCDAAGPFGLIIVGSDRPWAFSSGQGGDVVFALARIASHSIQNAHLYREAVRSQEQLVSLQMISHIVASSAQTDRVLEVIMREASEITGDSQAWLYLSNVEGGTAELHSRPKSAGQWSIIHQEATAWVMRAGQPIFYNPEMPLAPSPILVHGGPAMCVPLEAEDVVMGALVIMSGKPQRNFSEDDMIVLRTLANAAAAALHTREMVRRFECGYLELAQAWATESDTRLWGAPGHARRVASNALLLAEAVDVPAELRRLLQVAAYLHHSAAETAAEDTLMSVPPEVAPHAQQAAVWLTQVGFDSRVAALVRYHQSIHAELAVPDGELGRAAGVLALVHAVDAQLLMALRNNTNGAAAWPVAGIQLGTRLVLTDDTGGKFSPIAVEKYLDLLRAGRIALPER